MLTGKQDANGHLIFEVRTWQAALDLIDQVPWTLDGIDGMIKVDQSRPFETRVFHEASPKGKRSPQYIAERALLRDDYITDLTDGERLVGIMHELGIRFESDRGVHGVRLQDV